MHMIAGAHIMLREKSLQKAYDDFIINYSTEKGLKAKTVQNKKDILDKLIPLLTRIFGLLLIFSTKEITFSKIFQKNSLSQKLFVHP